MANLLDICFLCLNNNIKVQSVLIEDTDGTVVIEKLRCFFSEIIDSTPDAHKLACSECLEKLRISYDFKQSVIRNNTSFKDYIDKLKCQHKSYEELLVLFARSKQQSIIPFTTDFTANKDEKCGEEHDNNRLKFQNENLIISSTNLEQLNDDQSCKSVTNENNMLFPKFNCQTKDINLKTESTEIEEIYIKEEPHDDDFSGNYLDENSKESEDNIYECQICHLGFSSPVYLENHTDHCNKQLHKPDRIVTKTTGDDTGANQDISGSFKCHLCDNMYTIKSLYERHLLVKHCLYDYGKNQKTNAKYNQNHRTKNTDSNSTSNDSDYNDQPKQESGNKRVHKCSVCQKAFTRPYFLEKHSRIHSGVKPYECQTCHKTFAESGNLKKHKLTHTGEKPFSCDICQKSYNRNNKLIAHKRSHDNVRPYQCSVCKKTFTQTSILTRHMIIHTGQKPYHCNICQYKCTQAGDLNKHITRTHTGEKPYACKHCWKSYSWPSDLKEHTKKYHNTENA